MKTKTCIVCPQGCKMQYDGKNDQLKVEGNNCKRGIEYIRQEQTLPVRNVSTIVKINNAITPMCPVNSLEPIPKYEIEKTIEKLNKLELSAPVKEGSIVLEYESETLITIVVSRDLEKVK